MLAVRRTLDYLATGIGAYFKREHQSFRALTDRSMEGWKPEKVAAGIHAAISADVSLFAKFLSTGDDKSVRDRITHREFVSAGTLNVTPQGIVLAGGPEALGFGVGGRLLPALEGHLRALESLISKSIDSLVAGDLASFAQPAGERLHVFRAGSDVDDRLREEMRRNTNNQWQDGPFVSECKNNESVWRCMVCSWASPSWLANGDETSSDYRRAEEAASTHIQWHRAFAAGHEPDAPVPAE
jgi:hypothetical protein